MAQFISIYGKGGIGKSTITSHIAVCFRKRGLRVLQVGCDPKHDSTYSITGRIIPTVSEALLKHDFHSESIPREEIIYSGYMDVRVIEIGGPPAGVGCGGYVIGEGIQIMSSLNIWDDFDIVLFDVLGDVVCGGFSIPLQYSQHAAIVATDDFDSLYVANRITAAIKEKSQMYPLSLLGIIANKCSYSSRLEKFAQDINTTLISAIDESPQIKNARICGKTIFQMAEENKTPIPEETTKAYEKIIDYYFENKEQKNESIKFMTDKEMFSLYMQNNPH